MDNIIIKKIYDEDGLIELRVTVITEFVNVYQNCYIDALDLKNCARNIIEYANNYNEVRYIEFGKKEGNYTPAFSLKFLDADVKGHLKIEADIEIDDIDNRSHRCCCYVNSELGLIEKLGKSLDELVTAEIDTEIKMCDD